VILDQAIARQKAERVDAEPTLWRYVELDDATIEQLRRLLFGAAPKKDS
jgi:hypothetical protein